jgi:hypothetical protein
VRIAEKICRIPSKQNIGFNRPDLVLENLVTARCTTFTLAATKRAPGCAGRACALLTDDQVR